MSDTVIPIFHVCGHLEDAVVADTTELQRRDTVLEEIAKRPCDRCSPAPRPGRVLIWWANVRTRLTAALAGFLSGALLGLGGLGIAFSGSPVIAALFAIAAGGGAIALFRGVRERFGDADFVVSAVLMGAFVGASFWGFSALLDDAHLRAWMGSTPSPLLPGGDLTPPRGE